MDIKRGNVLWRRNPDNTLMVTLGDLGSIMPGGPTTVVCSKGWPCQQALIGLLMHELMDYGRVRTGIDLAHIKRELQETYGDWYANLIPTDGQRTEHNNPLFIF